MSALAPLWRGLDLAPARSHGRSYVGQRCELLGTRRRGRIAALLFVNDAGYARKVVVAWDADAQGPNAQGQATPPSTHLVAELWREP